MGNQGCCELNNDPQSFLKYCQKMSSAQYKKYLSDIKPFDQIDTTNQSYNKKVWVLGDFQAQSRHGQGIIFEPNRYYYEGGIRDEKPDGNGFMIWATYEQFKGQFKSGKAHGKGKFYYNNIQNTLEGIWIAGLPKRNQEMPLTILNNNLKITFLDSHFPIHSQDNNQFQGLAQINVNQVMVKLQDGVTYIGEVELVGVEYVIQGKGELKFKDGSYYKGEFLKGKMHGQGTYYWAGTKHTYTGGYVSNIREGFGIYDYNNGKIISGKWKGGKLVEQDFKQI